MISEFINPLLFFILANSTTTIIFDKKFEKVLPITLLSVGLVLYISGLVFQTFNIGIAICLIYALYSIIYVLKNKDEGKKISKVANNVLSYGLVMFVTIYCLVFVFDLNRFLIAHDDFSHWGMMVKEMLRLDKFYSVPESNLMVHKDYPPFISLYEMFWIRLTNVYSEATLVKSMHILELSMIIPLISIDEKNRKVYKEIIITSMIFISFILILNLMDHHKIINSLYVEYLIMFVTLYGLWSILKAEKLTSSYTIANTFVVILCLALLKQISICFSLMIAFYYFLMIVLRRKQEFKEMQKKDIIQNIICTIILFVIVPVICFVFWKIYVNKFAMDKQFVVQSSALGTFIERFRQKNFVINKYVDAVARANIMNFKFRCSILVISIIAYVAYLITIVRDKDRKDYIILLVLLILGNIAYLTVILFTYLVLFAPGEANILASFDRYVGSYLIMPVFSIYIIITNKLSTVDLKKQFLCFVLISGISIGITKQFTKDKVDFIAIRKRDTDNYIEAINFIKDNYDSSNIFFVSQIESDGKIRFKIQYYLNYMKVDYATKIRTAFIPVQEQFNQETIIKDYLKNLGHMDYLYVLDSQGKFKEEFAKDETVFKVTYENDDVILTNN